MKNTKYKNEKEQIIKGTFVGEKLLHNRLALALAGLQMWIPQNGGEFKVQSFCRLCKLEINNTPDTRTHEHTHTPN